MTYGQAIGLGFLPHFATWGGRYYTSKRGLVSRSVYVAGGTRRGRLYVEVNGGNNYTRRLYLRDSPLCRFSGKALLSSPPINGTFGRWLEMQAELIWAF
jgi:hypothetical protein